MTDDWQRARELFEQALDLEPDARERMLVEACAGRESLLEEVRTLLQHAAQSEGVIEPPQRIESRDEAPRPAYERVGAYRIERLIASGGMGSVWLGHRDDAHFEKTVAIKFVRTELGGSALLSRFHRERQVLAVLEHKNIARLLDGGTARDGAPYLVMEYVEGQPITSWADARRLELGARIDLFVRACEAVEYAHQRHVIHRDIKPGNLLVTSDGEPKLLDFGIAKVVQSDTPGMQTVTVTGEQVLSPRYASPEQCLGATVTPATDVYSLGVLLYELLTGRLPYGSAGSSMLDLQRAICEDPPTRASRVVVESSASHGTDDERPATEIASERGTNVAVLQKTLSGDLDLILAKALSKEPERRYRSVGLLAEDLQRYLDGQPILARPDSFGYRTRKFVERNKPQVASALVVFLTLAAATVVSTLKSIEAAENESLARESEQAVTRAKERLVLANEDLQAQRDQVLRLSDFVALEDLRAEAEELWPAWPALASDMEDWLARAREPEERIPLHLATLWRLRLENARELQPGGALADARPLVADFLATTSPTEAVSDGLPHPPAWTFDSAEDTWQHDALTELVAELEQFASANVYGPTIASVEARIEVAHAVGALRAQLEDAWADCSASVLGIYQGFELAPQTGLVPLRPDPRSGLWEFLVQGSGEIPDLDPETDRWRIEPATGIVLVLLPGGEFDVGASLDPGHPRYDPQAQVSNTPPVPTLLDPYFLSRYEVTQAQWLRLTGSNPSTYSVGELAGSLPILETNPVEKVSYYEAVKALRKLGLEVPTEAQWEFACRATTDTVFEQGNAPLDLVGYANLADEDSRKFYAPAWQCEPGFRDSFVVHGPVGSLEPNGFGLHDMHGNLWEWCADYWGIYDGRERRAGDGLTDQIPEAGQVRVHRGGSYADPAHSARSAERAQAASDNGYRFVGIRPMRRVQRAD